MKVSGSALLPAPPQQVWELLTDPARLAKLLPGCERLDPDGPDRFKAAVNFAIAAISGKYAGSLEFLEKKPGKLLRLKIEGQGIPGYMHGEGSLEFHPRGEQTELRYQGEAQVGGLVAAVGQRMIDMAARKIIQQFFDSTSAALKKGA